MAQLSATERTVKFATTVDDLSSAWAFVMAHVDEVGEAPQISINPFWRYNTDEPDAPPRLMFEASVSGMVEEPKEL